MKRKLLFILFAFVFSSFAISQETSKLNQGKLTIEQLHGPTVVVPSAVPGGSRAIGDDCTDPIIVSVPAATPYTDASQTNCGRGNTYDATCLDSYDGGEDIIYRLDVTADGTLDITMDPKGTGWTGILIADACPDVGTCLDFNTGSSGTRSMTDVSVTAGNSYYIMVDTWPSPTCIPDFDLTITHTPPPTCPDPTLQTEDNITVSSADLGWTENGSATTWEIEWGIAGFAQGSGTIVSTTDNPHFLGSLAEATIYDWYVRSDCGGEYSDWVGISSFTTLASCPVPTAQTVTNITTSGADLGWTDAAGTQWDIYVVSNGDPAPVQGTTPTANDITTIPFVWSGGSAATTYDWYVRRDCDGDNVGTSTWVGASTFTTAQTPALVQSIPFTEDWETGAIGAAWNTDAGSVSTIEVNTGSVHDGTYGLEQYGNSSSSFITPSDLADAYTRALPGGTNENWTSWNQMSVDLTTATNPWLTFWYAMGYIYNTNYNNFWVQISTDGSTWTDLFSTQTITAIPYTKKIFDLTPYNGEGQLYIRFFHNGKYIDNYLWLDDITVQEVTCPDPTAQTETNITATSADLGWIAGGTETTWNIEWGSAGFAQGTGTMITGITTNPQNITGLSEFTSYDWYVQADCGGGSESAWVGPSTFTTLCPSCCSHSVELIDTFGDGWNGGFLDVFVDGNLVLDGITIASGGGPETSNFDALTGSDIDVYYTSGSYASENEYTVYDGAAAILGQSGQSGAIPGDLLDLVGNCPSCPPPTAQTETNITTTSADLGWTDGSGTQWDIYLVANGDPAPVQGTTPTANDITANPYPWSGGNAATTYDWYVRRDCDGDNVGTSDWVGASTFSTSCVATSIPYFENFDAETVPAFPICMVVENTNADGLEWETDASGLSAPNCAQMTYNGSLAMDDWFFTQGLQLTGGTTYVVSFAYGAETYPESLEVDWGNAAASTSMSGTPIFSAIDFTGKWYAGDGTFTPATTGTYYVGFHGFSSADQFLLSVDDVKVLEEIATTTWAGTVDNDWDTPGNWNPGLPTSATAVTIPTGLTNYPTVASATSIGSLLVKSDAMGNASLLNDGLLIVSGDATVQRYITGGVWHDISASVQGQTLNSFYFGGSPEVWTARRNEPTNDWTYLTDLNDPLDPGAGFDIWVEPGNNVVINYIGTLNRADVALTTASTPPLSYTVGTPQTDYGYNLIGNPFASPLDLDEGIWSPTDVSTSFWVWDQAGSTYKDWNTTGPAGSLTDGIVPMGQGFFCQATGAAPALTIPMGARVHSPQAYYKSSPAEGELLQMSLRALMEKGYDEMNIVFHSEADEIFDAYDTRKMFASFGNAAQIYSEQYVEQLSINSLPLLTDEGYDVKVGYQTGVSGEQILEANLENLPKTEVFLEDLVTGEIQSLVDNPQYKFEASVDDEAVRFILHFNPMVTGIGDAENEDLIFIYAFDNKLYIKSSGAAAKEDKQVWVYDLSGRTAIQTTAEASTLASIPIHHLKGFVIVKVMSESGVKTAKVFIK